MSLLKFFRKSDVGYVIAIQQDGYGNAVKALRDYCYGYFMGVFLHESGLSKYDAEDYFQEAFVTLWTQISTKNIVEKNGRLYRWKFDKSTYQTSLFSFDRDIRAVSLCLCINDAADPAISESPLIGTLWVNADTAGQRVFIPLPDGDTA